MFWAWCDDLLVRCLTDATVNHSSTTTAGYSHVLGPKNDKCSSFQVQRFDGSGINLCVYTSRLVYHAACCAFGKKNKQCYLLKNITKPQSTHATACLPVGRLFYIRACWQRYFSSFSRIWSLDDLCAISLAAFPLASLRPRLQWRWLNNGLFGSVRLSIWTSGKHVHDYWWFRTELKKKKKKWRSKEHRIKNVLFVSI